MPRILIIEDDALLREVMRDTLLPFRHEVHEAANGREAILMLERRPVDLAITDMLMPEMEGVETIRAIQREFPAVKIIAMSGGGVLGAPHLLTIAQKLGVKKTLQKPFQPAELLEAVDQMFE